ncbi:heavy metal-associated isoprenylated plant protein 35-like [Juglans microcarpa x Juglans regia]|uniref:heavy metal-associated isoprenylated plant protein 35-like n=1 Tax=Juglans microcarpa x Juglans regia TaxID=2249226 RepID=UPI001B7E0C58|nr:heavy metal-associated isoprenylated plant protein 35-like [Juglans microcarpa x Juglans regia]
MNMMTTKKMKGFMCQSPAATAVLCMTDDSRSVIVPRKSDQRILSTFDNKRYLLNNGDYSRFVESPNYNKRSDISVPRLKREYQDTDLDQQRPAHDLQMKPSSVLPSSDNVFQVVVMRVSIHCQGCAGKLKRHLSKMEGVTSFSIELETKRVTVMGHVSPAGVLESISKVKKAEFWPSLATT